MTYFVWFLDAASGRCIIASNCQTNNATIFEFNGLLNKSLTDEQKKYAKVFYCEGGLNYEKMPLGSKMLMKTFAAMLNSKKDKTPDDIAMAEHVSKSGDYTDKKFIEPIAAYITQ